MKYPMKTILLVIIILVVVGIAVVFFLQKDEVVVEESSSIKTTSIETPDILVNVEHIVVYEDNRYVPASLTISLGDRVVFRNMSSSSIWPASNVHPSHTIYPGSGIQKCGGGKEIFDACSPVPSGQEWSFVFSEEGTWRYHNHMRASTQGTILVK